MIKRYYRIHNFLSFSILYNENILRQSIETTTISFQNFEVKEKISHPDFTVEIGPFQPRIKNCKILDDTYYINENYIYFPDHRKFAKWQTEISNIDTTPLIRIHPNLAGCVTKSLNLIEFFIQYCLLKKGYSVIHAGGLSLGEKVYLFPGTSGGGKTTISLSLIDNGYSFLGDNYVIIKDNIAYSYMTPLNIFSYNRVPLIERALSASQKFSLLIRKFIHDFSMGYIKFFLKINPKSVFKNQYADQGRIDQICFLDPNDRYDNSLTEPSPIGSKDAVEKLKANMELEWLRFSKFIYSYGFLYPNSFLGNFWKIVESTLMKNLIEITAIYRFGVPSAYSSEIKNKVVDSIAKLHQHQYPPQ